MGFETVLIACTVRRKGYEDERESNKNTETFKSTFPGFYSSLNIILYIKFAQIIAKEKDATCTTQQVHEEYSFSRKNWKQNHLRDLGKSGPKYCDMTAESRNGGNGADVHC
jgi:hypothetical protein